MKNQHLIDALNKLPDNWTPLPVDRKKRPLVDDWQKGFSRETVIEILTNGYHGINKEGKPYFNPASTYTGFGFLTGELSGGIVAIDCDGIAAHELAERLGGLPKTVSFTSGKEGRAQYLYQIPSEYWGAIQTKKLNTGVKENNKDVLLELRWNGCQSVLPPSQHPETDGYKWLNDLTTPIADCPMWIIEQMLIIPNSTAHELPLFSPNRPQQHSDKPIPLYNCLSKDSRSLIEFGAGDGGRNDGGAKVARDLIGTESRLQYLGFEFTGRARDLFDDYCDRCNPRINDKERETIWNSAIKSNPTPCLSDDKLENCYKAWTRKSINTSKTNYQTSGNAALKPEQQSNVIPFQRQQQPQLDIDSIEGELRALAEQNLSKSKLSLAINKLAKQANLYPKELESIYNKIQQEQEQELDNDSIKTEIDDFLENQNQSLNMASYLPGNLSKISELSTRLCLRPELGLTILYTTISSLLKVGSKIRLSDYTDFDQPMGLYSAIVAEPSQRKSPLINAIATKPLRELQKKAKDEFKEQMKQYELDIKDFEHDDSLPEPIKPTMRRYYINGGSGAGMRDLINAQSKNSWGMTILSDELSSHFKSQKKSYNVGQTEDLLSYYDGFGKIDALKDGLASDFEECLVSILGGIQPKVIREFNDGSDDNGSHARFNFVNQPTVPFLIPENPQGSLDLLPLITSTYEKISELPQLDLRLSPEAKKHFEVLNNKCEMYRVKAKSQALAALWGKMPGKIGRFAALIHVVEGIASNQEVTPIVERGTLIKASKLAKFYFKEAQNLYAGCGDELAPQLARLLNFAQRRETEITAREVKQSDRAFGKPDEIRELFTQLVSMGYGSVVGSGSRLKYKFSGIIQTVDNCRQTVDKTVDGETTINNGLQPFVDIVDKKQKKLEQVNQMDVDPWDDDKNVTTQPTVDKLEKTVDVENLSTMSTVPPNSDTVTVPLSTNTSTDCLQNVYSLDYDKLKPTNFDNLDIGGLLFGSPDVDGKDKKLHLITERVGQLWQTDKGEHISRDMLTHGRFNKATLADMVSTIEMAIVHSDVKEARWLINDFSKDPLSLFCQALRTDSTDQLKLIYELVS